MESRRSTMTHTRNKSGVIPAVPLIFGRQTLRQKSGNVTDQAGAQKPNVVEQSTPRTSIQSGDYSLDGSGGHAAPIDGDDRREPEQLENGIEASGDESPGRQLANTSQPSTSTAQQPEALLSFEHAHVASLQASHSRSGSAATPQASKKQMEAVVFGHKNKLNDATDTASRPYRARSVHHIAFGSFGNQTESSESSPTLPPSAASTGCTQPTPISETRSEASKSENGPSTAGQASSVDAEDPRTHKSGNSLAVSLPPGLMASHAVDFTKFQQHFLAQYVQDLYGRPNGDIALEVRFPSGSVRLYLHSAIMYQSPMFVEAIKQRLSSRKLSAEGRVEIAIGVQDKFTSVASIEAVLKSMYGIASFDLQGFEQGYVNPQYIFALFASSCLLGAPNHQSFGAACIANLLSWETLPEILDLCLTGQRFAATRDPHPRRLTDLATPLFQPQVTPLLDRALSLLVHEVNQPDFKFDPQSPNIKQLGGLPPELGGSGDQTDLAANATLSGPSDSKPNQQTVVSGILLSLPLLVLQRVMASISGEKASELAAAVVEERQRRRELWGNTPGLEELAVVKEVCIPVESLSNGIGLLNDML